MAETDIVKFAKDILGVELLPYQEDLLRRVEKGETLALIPMRNKTLIQLDEIRAMIDRVAREYKQSKGAEEKPDIWNELWTRKVTPEERDEWLYEVKAAGDERKAGIFDQIRTARNKLYEDLPTGDVDAFALLKVVQSHVAKLDEILGEGP